MLVILLTATLRSDFRHGVLLIRLRRWHAAGRQVQRNRGGQPPSLRVALPRSRRNSNDKQHSSKERKKVRPSSCRRKRTDNRPAASNGVRPLTPVAGTGGGTASPSGSIQRHGNRQYRCRYQNRQRHQPKGRLLRPIMTIQTAPSTRVSGSINTPRQRAKRAANTNAAVTTTPVADQPRWLK